MSDVWPETSEPCGVMSQCRAGLFLFTSLGPRDGDRGKGVVFESPFRGLVADYWARGGPILRLLVFSSRDQGPSTIVLCCSIVNRGRWGRWSGVHFR